MLKSPRLSPRDINHAINNNMRDMDTLGPELASKTLRQRPKGKLSRCEGRERRRAFQTSSCAGEN